MDSNLIPKITNELGRYWDQPNNSNFLIDDTHVIMDERSFNKLKNYSNSIPTGAYEGKMWKGVFSEGGWYLAWYGTGQEPGMVSIHRREIILID